MQETRAVVNLILAETRQRGEVLWPVTWRIRLPRSLLVSKA